MRLKSRNPRRVRLTAGGGTPSNPPREQATMPKTAYFDGVAVRDPHLAALIASAEQQGFRVEAAANGGHQRGSGLAIYPPDTSHSPVRFGVVQVHPKHTANVRSQLRASGYIDPEQHVIDLTDQATTTPTPEDSTMARTPKKDTHGHSSMEAALEGLPEGERAQFVAHVAASAVQQIGVPPTVGALVGVLVETLAEWARDPAILSRMAEDFGGAGQEQVDEALALAEQAEARAVAAEAALGKAEHREQQARKDCGDALDRAKTAEARADSLDAALRPLRAILAPQ